MIENSKLGYRKHVLDEFEFGTGQVLQNIEVEYTTRGTPEYDEDGNVSNAVIFCHAFDGDCLSIADLENLIGSGGELYSFNFFYISITSLGYPKSCSPSTTGLKFDFPEYTFKDCVNFKRKLLAEVFNIKNVLGIFGTGIGGYETYTWACEYPDEMEFAIIANSSFKTSNYRYIISKTLNTVLDSSYFYQDHGHNEHLSSIMLSIYSIIYSQYFSKTKLEDYSRYELDLFMDNFVEEGLFVDTYDFKYRNDALLHYDVEDKLSNIKAKILVVGTSGDIYYSPKLDIYPLEDKIEHVETYVFNGEEHLFNYDYSKFADIFKKFLKEVKK